MSIQQSSVHHYSFSMRPNSDKSFSQKIREDEKGQFLSSMLRAIEKLQNPCLVEDLSYGDFEQLFGAEFPSPDERQVKQFEELLKMTDIAAPLPKTSVTDLLPSYSASATIMPSGPRRMAFHGKFVSVDYQKKSSPFGKVFIRNSSGRKVAMLADFS